jgi:indoleacetamide hydrolase
MTVAGEVQRRQFLLGSSALAGGAAVASMLPAPAASAASANLTELGAVAAVEAMRKGEIKAEDYARTLLDRAQALAGLNAFRLLNRDTVLEAARAADQARASGAALGSLHGLLIPVTDSINTKALPTSGGTRALQGFRPKDDAAVLKPLFAQGAILMGKTNLHELSFGWTSNNGVFGAVRNPYDRDRVPGGSSGGSAAAVAARTAPLAVAADTLGSLRVPAAMCGLAGLRPTFGRYPDDGVMPLTASKFDQVGALARSVADLALFDSVLIGDPRGGRAMALNGVRIGISPDYFFAGLDREVERVSNEACRRLVDAGVTMVKSEIPEGAKAAMDIAWIIIAYETVPSIEAFLREQDTGVSFEQLLEQASDSLRRAMQVFALPPNRPSQETYDAALVKREKLRESIRRYFETRGIAALAFPPVMIAPPKIGEDAEIDIRGQKIALYMAMSRNLSLGSCASMPGLVLPAGMTSTGLPVGMEFDAPAGRDRDLLSLGVSLEKVLGAISAPKV